MTLIQTEPKSIKIGTTAIKRITIRPNGTEKQIRPVMANRLAYYPLTQATQGNDESGHYKHMTVSGSVTFGTYAGVSCAYFNGGYLVLDEALITGANPRTISCWYNRQNAGSEGGAFWGMGTASNNAGITAYVGASGADNGKIAYGNWGWDVSTGVDIARNSWHLLTVTYDGSTIKMYGDTTQISSKNQVLALTSGKTTLAQMPNIYGNQWKGYMSNFIFDNYARTAAEVPNYYNQTKGNYGL